jgi:hypothetical protein
VWGTENNGFALITANEVSGRSSRRLVDILYVYLVTVTGNIFRCPERTDPCLRLFIVNGGLAISGNVLRGAVQLQFHNNTSTQTGADNWPPLNDIRP